MSNLLVGTTSFLVLVSFYLSRRVLDRKRHVLVTSLSPRKRRRPPTSVKAWIAVPVTVTILSLLFAAATYAANPQPAEIYFIPLPETQVRTALRALYSGVGTTIRSVGSMVVTGNNAIIYYDHWEDGYELDMANPIQASSEIWGDGDASNGAPPGCSLDTCDLLDSGDVIAMDNNVPLPRNSSNILFDGRDKVGCTQLLAVTRAAWATSPGPVLAGAVEVYKTDNYGTYYEVPVGEDLLTGTDNDMFEYTSLLVMARENNTQILIDTDGNGSTDITQNLNQGESYQVNGGIDVGATITADKSVQVHLLTGDIGARYESRWFALTPSDQWTADGYSPVGQTLSSAEVYVFVYNPDTSSITVNYETQAGTGNFDVPANDLYRFTMPSNSGAHFYTDNDEPFYAISTIDSDTSNATFDWGFSLVPQGNLTTDAVVGWGPGTGDLSANGSPVWAIAAGPTDLYVDYDNDPSTGPYTDPNGNQFDVLYTLDAFASQRIYDNNDRDQTGMHLYTLDNTLITAAWGQDPANASPGNPYLDMGTTIPPQPAISAGKDVGLYIEEPATTNGFVDANETLIYTITIENDGAVDLPRILVSDTLPLSVTYKPTTTYLDGTSILDNSAPPSTTVFPLDEGGYNLGALPVGETRIITFQVTVDDPPPAAAQNEASVESVVGVLASAVSVPIGGSSCALTNTTGAGQTALARTYLENDEIWVRLDDQDENTNINSQQTVTVTAINLVSGDRETFFLQETGNDTGIFEGYVVASNTSGQGIEDGTLHVTAGDIVTTDYNDPDYAADECTSDPPPVITLDAQYKTLYLSEDISETQGMDRIDPGATGDTSTSSAAFSGEGGSPPSGWTQALKLVFTNTTVSNLDSFPVLVKLNSSRIDYGQTRNQGQDIRFYDSDESTPLDYEIEEWNESGDSYVWVNVPQIDASSTTDHIWLYYGNSGASDGQDAEAVWDSNFRGVWHLSESSGTRYDSTSNGFDGTPNGDLTGAVGQIDGANEFDGDGDYVSLADNCLVTDRWTFESWIYSNNAGNWDRVFTQGDDGCASRQIVVFWNGDRVHVRKATDGQDGDADEATAILSDDTWYYIVWTYDGSTDVLYLDGTTTSATPQTGVSLDGNNYWGRRGNTNPWNGRLDEGRLSNTPRSADWVKAQYDSMTDNFITYGGGTTQITFTQTQAMAADFTMPAGGVISVTLYVSSGSALAEPLDITATLQSTSTPFITLTDPTLTDLTGGIYRLVWSGALSGDLTVPPGNRVQLQVVSAESASLTALYDSNTRNSRVDMPAATLINAESLIVYDAAYSDGTEISSAYSGQMVYVRPQVSDPFGYDDIVTSTLEIMSPCGILADTTLTNTYAVSETGAFKTYEYDWKTTACTGTHTITVTTFEGYEGISDTIVTLFEVNSLDVGTPGTVEFIDGTGALVDSYPSATTVCIEVTDMDQAGQSDAITVTITTSSGDSETLTLSETGPSTGVFTGCISANVGGPTPGNNVLNAPPGDVLNVTYTDPNDPDDSDDDSAIITTVTPEVAISKSLVDPADGTAVVGDLVQFDILVSNPGPTTLTTVAVTDTFPSACLTYFGASTTPSSVSAPTIIWNNIGPIASGGSEAISVYFVSTAACTPGTNSVIVGGDDGSTTVSDGPTTSNVTVNRPELEVSKVKIDPSGSTVTISNTVTYRIAITNTGTTDITSLPLVDDYSSFCLEYQSSSPNADGSGGGMVLWNDLTGAGALNTGLSTSVVVTFHVKGPCSPAVNTAEIEFASDENGDPVPSVEDSTSITTQAEAPEITLSKSLSEPASGVTYVGDTVTFTVLITNTGPNPITQLILTDTYDSGCMTLTSWNITPTQTSAGQAAWNTLIPNEPPLLVSATMTLTLGFRADDLSASCNNVATAIGKDPFDQTDGPETTPPAGVEVRHQADLSLDLDVTNTTPDVGSTVVFTLTVTNDGPHDATGVSVTDLLPNGYTYVGDDGDYVSGTGVWTVGNLNNGDSATLLITATVEASGNYSNYAQVSASNQDDPDSTPGDNSITDDDDDTQSVTPNPIADLSLDLDVTNTTSDVGNTVVFTLTVTNDGPSDATGVSVTDLLPDGYTYVGDDGDYVSGTGVWTVGNLNNGDSATLLITATVNAAGDYSNYAQVSASNEDDSDSTPGDNSTTDDDDDTQSVTPNPIADLSLDLDVTNTTPDVGSTVVFTLTVTNDGPSDATGVSVTDLLPNGYTYVGDNGDYVSGTGVWTVGNLNNGDSATLLITATVEASGNYSNYAQVSASNQDDPDSTPGDNSTTDDDDDTQSVTPNPIADLSLDLDVTNTTPDAGSTVVFTLTVTNDGPSDATGVSVTDLLPNGYTYVGDDGDYVSGTGVWTVGNLNNGDSATLLITATVEASGNYSNYAQVSASNEDDSDSTPGDNSTTDDDDDTQSVTPNAVADLALDKTSQPVPAVPGAAITYTLVVTNDGPSALTAITLIDNLPAAVQSPIYIESDGSYNEGTGVWTSLTFGAGDTISLTIVGTLDATFTGTLQNTATVTPTGATDPEPSDNPADDDNPADPQADLALAKTSYPRPAVPGDPITYTLVVDNNGPSAVTAITLTDNLPTTVQAPIVYTESDGSYDEGTGAWTSLAFGAGDTITLTIVGTLDAAFTGTLQNTATVTPSGATDPEPSNDSNTDTNSLSTGTVTGVVYLDVNGDGDYDPGIDTPLPGIDVTIIDSGGAPSIVTTDINGTYTQTVLAGLTTVDVDDTDPQMPPGATLTVGNTDPTTVTVPSGGSGNVDVGYIQLGVVTGVIYLDDDDSGTYTPGDTPLPGVNVVITDVFGTVYTVTTGVDGTYTLTLPAGNATVDVDNNDLPPGATLDNGSTDPTPVVVLPDDTITDDTGYVLPTGDGTVTGVVYLDEDGDGAYTPGTDTPLAGVQVVITDSDGVTYTLSTGIDGAYTQTVPAGATVVDVNDATLPPGAVLDSGSTDPTTVIATAGNTVVDDTGYVLLGTLTGVIYQDEDGDGTYTPGTDTPLPGVDVTVTDANGVTYTLTTNGSGAYTLVVPAGDTTVDVDDDDLPPGSVLDSGSSDPTTVVVPPGDTVPSNTGYVQMGTVTGIVYLDDDGSGTYTPGDTPLSGVDVTITDTFGNVYVVTTDPTGAYTQTVPAGDTTVDVDDDDLPPGLVLDSGSTDPTTVTVPADGSITDDTGYVPPVGTGIVEGTIYLDEDGNGSYDPGTDTPLPGVDVVITDTNGMTYTVTTDVDGQFSVVLPDGNATVDVDDTTLPPGSVLDSGSTDPTPVVVPDGGTVTDDTGYEMPAGTGVVEGTVYLDEDGDGTYTPGTDIPLENVDVIITDTNGLTYTVTTDANGYYSETLPTGSATVDVDDTTLPPGSVLDSDSTDPTTVIVPVDGTVLDDTGYVQIGTVTGVVYLDEDGDGTYTPGTDTPLAGVDVVITDINGITYTVTTGANGAYTLTLPAGDATVDVDDTTLPPGAVLDSGSTDPTPVVVPGGNSVIDNTGYTLIGDLTGIIYLDEDGDGTYTPGTDTPISGVDVVITDAGGDTYTVTTDINGAYTQTVLAGAATVNVDDTTLPPGAILTTGSTDPTTVVVPPGGIAMDDTGYALPPGTGTVNGTVYLDEDGDGAYTPGTDTPLAGVQVVITDTDGGTYVVTTGADGSYAQTVPAGSTTVDVNDATLPPGSVLDSGSSDPTTVIVTDGGTATDDTGYTLVGDLTGVIYLDEDGDGVYTPGTDTPLPGVDVIVTDANGVTYTLTTDAGGAYTITLPAGDTTVDVDDADLPPGSVLDSGSSDPTTVVVPSGDTISSNTGYVQMGTVTGVIYLDDDNSGDYTPGVDTPLPGVDVTITDTFGNVYVVTTGPNGAYTQTVPAGGTTVDVDDDDLPPGLVLDSGSTDPTTVTVPADGSIADDTGYVPPAGTGIVNGTIYLDEDGNGSYDPGTDTPLPGVDVVITDTNGVTYTVTTNADGYFSLVVPDGNATVDVDDTTLPGGAVLDTGSNDPTIVNVPDGGSVTDDTGYEMPAGTGVVEGTVYLDEDGDGTYTPGTDTPLAGVDVIITDTNGLTYTVTTDANGYYSETLPTGSATVDVDDTTLPPGSTLDSGSTDPTTVIVPVDGTVLDDTGYVQIGTVTGVVYLDEDGDGTYTPGTDTPLAGVDVVITDTNGMTYTVTTGADGAYTLTLPAGDATVDVDDTTLPPGAVLDSGSTDPTPVVVPGGNSVIDNTGYTLIGDLTGIIYLDEDDDGIYTPGVDTPLAGVDVVITDSGGDTYTVTTDANGAYTQTVLAGAATVDVDDTTLPPGVTLTTGSTDPTTVVVPPGGIAMDDTGYVLPAGTGIVNGTIYLDENGDGAYTFGIDTPLPSVQVVITDANGVTYTLTTGADGTYSQTVPAGSTTVDVNDATLPGGAILDSGSTDPTTVIVPANDTSTVDVGYIVPERAIETTKRDTLIVDADFNGYPSPGDTLSYTIVISNEGSLPLTGIILNDMPDSNTTLVVGSVSTSQGSVTTGNTGGDTSVAVDVGDILPGNSVIVNFQITIDDPLPDGVTQIANTGLVSSNELPTEPTDDPDTPPDDDETITPVTADPLLDAAKTDLLFDDADGNNMPSPGDTIEYQIAIINYGNGVATGVVFDDILDPNTTLITGSVQTSQGTVTVGNAPGDTHVSVDVGTIISDGGTVNVTFQVLVNDPLPPGVTQIANGGTVSSDDEPVEPTDDPETPPDDDETITPLTDDPVLKALKIDSLFVDADGNGIPSPGDTLLYQITILNSGNGAATNVVFDDTIDPNTTLINGTVQTSLGLVTSGNIPGDTHVTVNVGTLLSGDSVDISFQVTIDDPLPAGVTTVANQGQVSSEELPVEPTDDPETPPEDDETITPVTADPLIEAEKSGTLFVDADGDGAPGPGDTLLYQVAIINSGNGEATGVTYDDTPDSNTVLLTGTVQTSLGTVTGGNGTGDTSVAVDIGTLPAGTQVDVSYQVLVNDPLPGYVTHVVNQGLVSSNELPVEPTDDPETPPDDDETEIPISTVPVLEAQKSDALFVDADDDGTPSPGDTLLYQVTIINSGNTEATNVLFDDTPDPNTDLVVGSVQTSQGTVTSGNNPGDTSVSVDVGTIPGGGASVNVSFRVVITNPLPLGVTQVSNQGVISSTELPPEPTDDPGTPEDDDETETIIVAAPEIEIYKTDFLFEDIEGDGWASPGDTLLYEVSIVNNGTAVATGIVFSDTVDPNTTLVTGSVQTSAGTVITGNNAGDSYVVVDVNDIPGDGASVSISFQVTVNDPLPEDAREVLNQGLISGDNFSPEPTDDPGTTDDDDETETPVILCPMASDLYEPDNLYPQATEISTDGTVQTRTLHRVADKDWVRFYAEAGGIYTITTSHLPSDVDTVLQLYDTDGVSLLEENDDYLLGSRASQVVWIAPENGWYYARVNHFDHTWDPRYSLVCGNYYLISVEETSSCPTGADIYEPNNLYPQAMDIPTDGTVQTHTLHMVADKDWIRFFAVENKTYTITTSHLPADVDTVLQLYDTDGELMLEENDDYLLHSDASRIVWTARATGWYYARINHFDHTYDPSYSLVCGNYYLVAVESNACAISTDDYEPDNFYSQAIRVPVDGSVLTRTFHMVADKDWVSFQALAGKVYTITTSQLSADVDTVLQLYDVDGVTMLEENDDTSSTDVSSGASRIVWKAPVDGRYYARINHVDHTYDPRISLTCGGQYLVAVETSACLTPADEYESNNFFTEAKEIPTDGTVQTHTLHTTADKDWLTFYAWGRQVYSITTFQLGPDVDTVMRIYDMDGVTLLTENDDYADGSKASGIEWRAPADGWYFIRITHFDSTYNPQLSPFCGNQYHVVINQYILDADKTAETEYGAIRSGDEISYTIVITNLMQTAQTNIVITDTIPNYTTYITGSVQVSQGSVYGPDPLRVEIDTLAAYHTATLTFRVIVDSGEIEPVTNVAIVTSDQQGIPIKTPFTTVPVHHYYYLPAVLKKFDNQ
ncbi:MAG: DUF2341 domain-containing protein [Chloroflexi bacterium]|nr:DUF2341 domain-containing protein [Chloroflexota bacterium]